MSRSFKWQIKTHFTVFLSNLIKIQQSPKKRVYFATFNFIIKFNILHGIAKIWLGNGKGVREFYISIFFCNISLRRGYVTSFLTFFVSIAVAIFAIQRLLQYFLLLLTEIEWEETER